MKAHPEESVSRTQRYLDQAISRGLGDRVTLLRGDAATAIDLGDIVLTAYSTAAIDAAIRQKPVVCVTAGDVAYPLDLASVVGAPTTRSAEELTKLIAAYRADPNSFQTQASSLIERETQFTEGPGSRLRQLISTVIDRGPEAIRDPSLIPESLFLDPPHPLFPV